MRNGSSASGNSMGQACDLRDPKGWAKFLSQCGTREFGCSMCIMKLACLIVHSDLNHDPAPSVGTPRPISLTSLAAATNKRPYLVRGVKLDQGIWLNSRQCISFMKNDASIALSCHQNRMARRGGSYERLFGKSITRVMPIKSPTAHDRSDRD